MNERNVFLSTKDMDESRVVRPYINAFGGEPWYEVSKCADTERIKRCAGGLSRLAVGELCELCGERPSRPAYEDAELIGKFEAIGEDQQALWYVEETEQGVALAALAWVATAKDIAKGRYADIPEMASWLEGALEQDQSFIWLDEIFADKEVRPSGNLRNFRFMTEGFMEGLGQSVMAFRTINPALVRATVRDFGEEVTVYERNQAVPDRRDFVLVRRAGE